MPIDRSESENMQITAVIKLLSNAFSDYDENIKKNEDLSKDLDEFVGKLERGEIPSNSDFSYLLNNAMERTKSDPTADEGKYDKLKGIAQSILMVLKIPSGLIHTKLLITLIKEFQEELLGSQRRHFHYRDNHWHDYVDRIFQSFEVIDPTTVYPTFNRRKSQKKKKITFRK